MISYRTYAPITTHPGVSLLNLSPLQPNACSFVLMLALSGLEC
nr:MAG TPA: hypothetical protein [Caudoviricetes sp.]